MKQRRQIAIDHDDFLYLVASFAAVLAIACL